MPSAPDSRLPPETLEELRESAGKYRTLIEMTDTGFVILDGEGAVVDANDEYVKLTGHERLDQIVGRSVSEWTAQADRARNTEEVRRCLRVGSVRNLEIDYLGPDGRLTPVEINASVGRGPGGVTIFTVCRGIAARRRVEQALRRSEHRYRMTIDSMGEAIHVVDENLRIELLNANGERWMRQIGITGEIVGRNIFEVFPFLPETVRDEYLRVFAGAGPLITAETVTVEGREISTETRKIPIVEAGRVSHVVTVMRDTTEMVRAQERLRQTEKLEAIGQLAGGIAHDFNNQLAVVLGYAELLARRVKDPAAREHASAIAQVALRAADLTRQLLTFARKQIAQSTPVDMHAVIDDLMKLLVRTIDPRIAVRAELGARCAVTTGDWAQLQSVLLNLALNARDAMPEGGALTFVTDTVTPGADAKPRPGEASGVEEQLRLRVTDTGAGMTDEVRRRAFEPFFTTKGPGHGTGMGLATVYGAITHHGGTIAVDSVVGRGTTITILLPLARGADAHDAPPSTEAPTRGRGHVLVADDDPAVRAVIAEALTELGYRVTARGDGAAALSFFQQACPEIDLVILDMMMPALGGLAALAEMRRIAPAVRAVLCSAQPIGPGEHQAVDDQAVVFLQKPFTMAELARAAASVLQG